MELTKRQLNLIISFICANIVAVLIYIRGYDISAMVILLIGISSLYRADVSKEERKRMSNQQRINAMIYRIILIIAYIYLFIVMVASFNNVKRG